ncbi:MAG: hypothetical protein AB7R90_05710 [Reyranellaceae bacterium]
MQQTRIFSATAATVTAVLALALGGAGTAQAQAGSERLLDSLIRGMQICSEINDSASRLSCYDEVSRTATGRAPAASAPAVRPGPGPGPGYVPSPSVVGSPSIAPSGAYDPDAAFDPNAQRSVTVPPEMAGEVIGERRTGPGPVPRGNPPLVTLGTPALNYNEGTYRWQVTASLTNNTNRVLDAGITCALKNNERSVTDLNWFPAGLRPGETVTVDMLGPSTQAYVNNVLCRVNYPI